MAVNNLNNNVDLEEVAYEFMTNAYTIFEDEISETEAKVTSLNLLTTTLFNLTVRLQHVLFSKYLQH